MRKCKQERVQNRCRKESDPAVQDWIEESAEEQLFEKRCNQHTEEREHPGRMRRFEKLVDGQCLGNRQKIRADLDQHREPQSGSKKGKRFLRPVPLHSVPKLNAGSAPDYKNHEEEREQISDRLRRNDGQRL